MNAPQCALRGEKTGLTSLRIAVRYSYWSVSEEARMTRQQAEVAVIESIVEVQEMSGRECPEITAETVPIGAFPDSTASTVSKRPF